jgi:hypothetical protein
VTSAEGKTQNIIYEYNAGKGMIHLPSGAQADRMVIWFTNTTKFEVGFSQPLYANSKKFTKSVPPQKRYKLLYSHANGKWYLFAD